MPDGPQAPVHITGLVQGLVLRNEGTIHQNFHQVRHAPFVPREAPATPTHWVERSALASDALDALAAQQVVALVGMGGAGKSALAACVAERAAAVCPRGCFWVSLVGGEVDDALLRIALAFGHDISALDSREARARTVRSLLTGQPVMLVLDDVWEAEDLAAFLPAPAGCRIVLTTRNDAIAAQFAGCVLTIDSLAPPDAVALLARAAQVSPGEPVLARLAHTLGGLPLALELAAKLARQQARRPGFAWARFADELADAGRRLDLKLGTASVRLAFDATWQRGLDDAGRRAFALLGLFEPGEITLDEAAAAWNADAPTAQALANNMLDLSLATLATASALRLHPLLADDAAARAEWLGAAERTAAHQRVADHHFDGAPSPPEGPAALARVLRSHRHAVLAVDRTRAQRVWPWFSRAPQRRATSIPAELGARGLIGKRLVHERLQHQLADGEDSTVRGWADYRLGDALLIAGEPAEAAELADRAVARFDSSEVDDDSRALGLSKFLLLAGQAHKQLGHWPEAEQRFRRAHAFDRALAAAGGIIGAQDGALIALLQLADLQTASRDEAVWQQGIDTIYAVFDEARGAGLAAVAWMAATRMAEMLAPRSASEAAEWLTEAWRIEDADPGALAGGRGATYAIRLARVASQLCLNGDLPLAEAMYAEVMAVRMARAAGSVTELCRALHGLGGLLEHLHLLDLEPPWAAAWAAYHLADDAVAGADFDAPRIGTERIERRIRPNLAAAQCDDVAAAVSADAWAVLAGGLARFGISLEPPAR